LTSCGQDSVYQTVLDQCSECGWGRIVYMLWEKVL